MINLALAVLSAAFGFGLLVPTGLLRPGEGLVPALILLVVAYVLLARRSARQVQAICQAAGSHVAQVPPRFERAVQQLARAYPLARWQFGVRGQIDAQVGMLWYLKGDLARALGPLKRSLVAGPWQAGAMLGVLYARRKDPEAARRTFRVVLRKAHKQPLAHCLWAYLLVQWGRREEALRHLGATRARLSDARLAEAHLALQNGRKLKLRGFGDAWYQFQLERPPAQLAQAAMAGRGMRRAMQRGRG